MTTIPWQEYMDSAGEGFTALPAGDYDAQITAAEATKTSNGSNKDMLKCVFTVTTGPAANRKIWNNFVISPESNGAMAYFFKHMAALGLTREYFAQSPTIEQVAQALIGRTARLKVGIQDDGPYKGNNEVNDVLPPSSGPAIPGNLAATVAVPTPQGQPIAPPLPTVVTDLTGPAPAPQVPLPTSPTPAPAANEGNQTAPAPTVPGIPALPTLPTDKPF